MLYEIKIGWENYKIIKNCSCMCRGNLEYLESLDDKIIEYEDEEITYIEANKIKKDSERRKAIYNNRAEMFNVIEDKRIIKYQKPSKHYQRNKENKQKDK